MPRTFGQALVDGDENSTQLVMRSVKNTERACCKHGAQPDAQLASTVKGYSCPFGLVMRSAADEIRVDHPLRWFAVLFRWYCATIVSQVFKNPTSQAVVDIEAEHPGDFSKIAHLVRGDNYRQSFQETGDPDSSIWSAGVCMGEWVAIAYTPSRE